MTDTATTAGSSHPLTFLLFYTQQKFWSMGEGKGAAAFSRTLASLASRGHRVHVFLPAGEDEEESTGLYRGVHLHYRRPPGRLIPRARLPFLRRMTERWTTWMRYQRWAADEGGALARELHPDVLIALGSFEAPAARRVAEELGIPNVTRLYGSWLPTRRTLRYYANFPAIWAFRTPAVAYLVTNDGSEGDVVARMLGVPMERFFFPRNGLDLERFCPGPPSEDVRRDLGISPTQPVIMTATRLTIEKRLERILDALPGIAARHPDVVLALIGDGEDRERLEARVDALGVRAQVRFVVAVAQEDIPPYARTATLALSLLDRTNASNPVFEAMACALPVLALDAGATRALIDDGRTGRVIGYEDLPRLDEIVSDLLDRPEALRAMGREAAEGVRKSFVSPEERLDFEVRLYEAAARRGPLPRWEHA